MNGHIVAKRLEISGVVQGVGFRPFLFGLARDYGLAGEVSNTAEGVCTVVEGLPENVAGFVRDIRDKPPLLARVTRVDQADVRVTGFDAYTIIKSNASAARATLISPDVTVCEDCLAEMQDPHDRRFGYPFINCTNCGPRFTIIQDIPYDRPKTSMKAFDMCPDCLAEYEDPLDRRFHAQPNACPVCGPRVFLTDNRGERLDTNPDQALDMAGQMLSAGRIVAVKGLGGFHLAVDAANDEGVRRLRALKNRPHKPFALMARSASVLFDHVGVSEKERELLRSFHRPIVLLGKKEVLGDAGLSSALAPRNNCLGIMLPYTPLHYLLLEKGPDILVMTSGNRSGEPLSIENADALDAFSHIADFFLMHDRDIYFRADDAIARVQAGQTRFLRRSRGYAPLPVVLERPLPPILGCGAGMKNTVCLTRGSQAFLSQHIGTLDNHKVYDFYTHTIDHLKKILDIRPEIIAHDLHPGYMSTAYAQGLEEIPKEAVQHHHAHAAACMAENHLAGPVVAVALDGTGYGTDGSIWGGEVLVCDLKDFTRRAHLSYLPMPGGDAAVLEPWRMATALLYTTFGRAFMDLELPWLDEMAPDKLEFLCRMMDKGINTPLTSSCGRLFDAVSSLLCIRHKISHESQAAMELEAEAAQADPGKEYPAFGYEIRGQEIDVTPCVREMVRAVRDREPTPDISCRFHTTLVAAFSDAAQKTALETGLTRVVLSGGVFNNDRVLTGMVRELEAAGLAVFTHTQVPAGDGGIALGQAAVAAARIQGAQGENHEP